MPTLKSAALMIATILGFLIAADIAGVVASLVFDILPLRAVSTPLFYAVWFVDGVFCGIFTYMSAGSRIAPAGQAVESSSAPAARRTGLIVIVTTAVFLIGLSVLFYVLWWQRSGEDDHYVPDNMALTITFFVALLGAMIFAHARPSKRNGRT